MIAATAAIGTDVDEQEAPSILVATIRAAKAGDQRAFEDLMIASEKRVALLAWRVLGDAEEVKEAVQETFLRLFRHLGRYDEQHDFYGWLYRISINVCRDLDRRRRRRRIFFAPLADALAFTRAPRHDERLTTESEMALVTRAIDALPQKERLAIILRDVEERPTDEVAAILGNTPSTVRVQVRNARAKVRLWVESWRKGAK
jgi:RNA polymerase sigma-70 factor (ECF subfamily)